MYSKGFLARLDDIVGIEWKNTAFIDDANLRRDLLDDTGGLSRINDQLNASFFDNIKGYKEGVKELEGLKVVDDLTFTVTLTNPEQDFPALGWSG